MTHNTASGGITTITSKASFQFSVNMTVITPNIYMSDQKRSTMLHAIISLSLATSLTIRAIRYPTGVLS